MKSSPSFTHIQKATEFLRDGKLVAFPTETVYGLGADAANPEAVAKIFAAKGRPADHPVIVHLAEMNQLKNWVKEINAHAMLLAEYFWPGPLTLILPKAEKVSPIITGGQDSIGIRIPSHPVAQALLQSFGGGVAAPSANRFGHISATQASHVKQELGNAVDFILEGDDCTIGIESTIVDVTTDEVRILRPGFITEKQISEILGHSISHRSSNSLRVSGNLASHYAPETPLQIVSAENLKVIIEKFIAENKSIAVLSRQRELIKHPLVCWVKMPTEYKNYAHDFYAKLREVDNQHHAKILVEDLPADEEWLALHDRLSKAAN